MEERILISDDNQAIGLKYGNGDGYGYGYGNGYGW